METIKFAKVKPNAIIPSKREEDAGFDVYACFDEDNLIIQPHETKLIPTGIASAFSNDYVFVYKERGSTGTKGMGQRAGVIDSGFRGEWLVPITNHNEKPLIITKETDVAALLEDYIVYPYTRAIAQSLFLPVPKTTIEEISYEELKKIESDRGSGMLGSSQK
jgi:dUTP pyrophosphatase